MYLWVKRGEGCYTRFLEDIQTTPRQLFSSKFSRSNLNVTNLSLILQIVVSPLYILLSANYC